tara:strand:+ start:474 stop:935 length:462 start_codon:yes stop_codon:yes gene_type:complete
LDGIKQKIDLLFDVKIGCINTKMSNTPNYEEWLVGENKKLEEENDRMRKRMIDNIKSNNKYENKIDELEEENKKLKEENKKGQEEYNRLMNSHVEYEKECHLLKEELKEAKEVATTIAGHAKFMEDVIEKMGEEICDDCKSKMTYQIVKPEDI